MTEWLDSAISYWRSGGPLLVPIALVCFGIWGCFLRTRERFGRVLQEGEVIARAWERGELTGNPTLLMERLTSFRSGVATMLRLSVRDAGTGVEPSIAFLRRETECLRLLRHDFLLLAALIGSAPLLGLLGTVMGMMDTFDAVSMTSGSPGARVAAGISRALITTQYGLAVALPGAFGLARLQRLLRHAQVTLAACRVHTLKALADVDRGGSLR